MIIMKARYITLSAIIALGLALGLSSCKGVLDLGPYDHYGSNNYWKNPEQAHASIVGIYSHFRGQDWQHMMTFGELRGGSFKQAPTSSDAMTLQAGDLRLQNIDEQHTIGKFGDIYGRITNLNLFIARVDGCGLGEAEKNYYLAQVYGLRAYYYFELHRVWGGVPIRLGVEVVDGERDPNVLYEPRRSPAEVLAQVRSDLEKSLQLFGGEADFGAKYGFPAKTVWSKAASECLAAEVALWSAKVTTVNAKADPSQIAVAKRHLESVRDNYGLSLQSDYAKIFDTGNKANSEIIFASRYLEGEAQKWGNGFMYDLNTGNAKSQLLADGSIFGNPFQISGGNQSYQYDDNLFLSFDERDSRRDATFLAAYDKKIYEETGKMQLFGTFLAKNIGHINEQGNRVFDGDVIYYRLAWVYTALAEVANYEGDNASVEKYINLLRKRAYGDKWDATTDAYHAGDFTQNELAILREKDKEFVNEGQRWWDLRRMQYTKGGTHLVFRSEAGFYHGTAELNEEKEAHKVLFPVDAGILSNDPTLVQTPGYIGGIRPYDGSWEK